MPDGFTVDYDALAEMGGDLRALAREFAGMSDQVGQYAEAVGSPPFEIGIISSTVADTLRWVARNWSDERGQIVEEMEAAATYATQAAEAYRDLDEGLSDELDDATG